MLLADIIDKREFTLQPALWFDRVSRKLHYWATRIRLWIRRAVRGQASLRTERRTQQHGKGSRDAYGKMGAVG